MYFEWIVCFQKYRFLRIVKKSTTKSFDRQWVALRVCTARFKVEARIVSQSNQTRISCNAHFRLPPPPRDESKSIMCFFRNRVRRSAFFLLLVHPATIQRHYTVTHSVSRNPIIWTYYTYYTERYRPNWIETKIARVTQCCCSSFDLHETSSAKRASHSEHHR